MNDLVDLYGEGVTSEKVLMIVKSAELQHVVKKTSFDLPRVTFRGVSIDHTL